MPGLILVPLDGSSLAARALPYAVAMAREQHLRFLLVRVLEPSPSRGLPLVQEPDARRYPEHVASQLREEGVEVENQWSRVRESRVASCCFPQRQASSTTPIASGGPNMKGIRSANHRGRKMSDTRPLSAPRFSAKPVSGQRPRLAMRTVDSPNAAASAGLAHRERRPDRPSQKMSRTDAELARKIRE